MKTFIIIACLVAAACLNGWLTERRRMRSYWTRVCAGSEWKKRFPQAPKDDIRQFLRAFMDAFAFSRSRGLRFTPNDRVMDVYRTLHPPKWTLADSMELESLAVRFQKQYGIDLVPVWRNDITLGDLFALTRQSAEQSGLSQ
jgi:hypothetical protein